MSSTTLGMILFLTFVAITLAITVIDWYFYPAILEKDWTGLAVSFVTASVCIALIQSAAVIAMKWLLMGVYKPGMQPMWSWWAMRTEAVAVLYWGLAGKVLPLADDVVVLPGHGEQTSIGRERATNPFLLDLPDLSQDPR